MGEIRFVGTGETRGYPYLVCKKELFIRFSVRVCRGRLSNFVCVLLSLSVLREG